MGLDLKPLKLWLIRIKNADKPVVLITSLADQGQYPHSIFSDLYHHRITTAGPLKKTIKP